MLLVKVRTFLRQLLAQPSTVAVSLQNKLSTSFNDKENSNVNSEDVHSSYIFLPPKKLC